MIWQVVLWLTILAVCLIVVFAWIDSKDNWTSDGKIGISFLAPILGALFVGIMGSILTGSGYSTSEFTKADETVYTVQEGADIDTSNGYVKTIINVNGKPEAISIDANRIVFIPGDKKEIKVDRYERRNRVTVPWDMAEERMVTITQGK
jgi:hypothetical protein